MKHKKVKETLQQRVQDLWQLLNDQGEYIIELREAHTYQLQNKDKLLEHTWEVSEIWRA